jgi:UMF1 family MFS transporter
LVQAETAPRREIFGWAMFDFANSSYTTVIVTVVYNVVFTTMVVGDAPEYRKGNFYWGLALALSYLLVVLTAPLLGAIMDYSAAKKRFLFFSTLITVLSSAALYFVSPGSVGLGILLIALSSYGFSIGESFASAFLPELGRPEDLGRISGFAWGLGYFGGLLSTGIVMLALGEQTLANFGALRFVGPITGAFFMLAAIPTFVLLKERAVPRALPPGRGYLGVGCERLVRTFKELGEFRDLMAFLVATFFAMAGLSIVIAFAFLYGDQVVRWSAGTKVAMFVITQITAAGGALVFGMLQDRIGALKTFNLTLLLWIGTVFLIWGVEPLTAAVNSLLGTELPAQHVFLGVGSLAGSAIGATQSASRALVGLLAPSSKAGEFFGFWGVAGKLAAAVGLLGLGALQAQVGLRSAILLCSVFFAAALFTTLGVDEARGRSKALAHEGE